jgi:DNA-directed RNA polymerase subunit RPC12/RpoP
MNKQERKAYKGTCIDCGEELELYEIDFEKKRKILRCKKCGLFHFYKANFWGKWKLVKAGRVSDLW